jgi:CBS domain-containing protein
MIDIHVEEIMTADLVTITESQSLAAAGRVMTEAGIKSVIVSDSADRPLGILTSTDFVTMAGEGTSPAETSVGDHMTRDIVTTTPDTVVYDAADLMRDHNISHLPVVDEEGRLTGMVTTTDVATHVSGMQDLVEE